MFLLLLVCSADLDVLCSGLFFHQVKFYCFIFLHKIRVVCVNAKFPKPEQRLAKKFKK